VDDASSSQTHQGHGSNKQRHHFPARPRKTNKDTKIFMFTVTKAKMSHEKNGKKDALIQQTIHLPSLSCMAFDMKSFPMF
jgi:hypothetical protein